MSLDTEQLSSARAVIEEIASELESPALEPNAARADWSSGREVLPKLQSKLERALTTLEATPGLDDDAAAIASARARASIVASELAGVLHAAGLTGAAMALLSRSVGLAAEGDRALLQSAQRQPAEFVRLCHGLWLQRRGQLGKSEKALAAIMKSSSEEPIRAMAKLLYDMPRPIKSAPALATFNGIGFTLYGERDREMDGSYITTWCFVVLFVPLLPLRAYRVERSGNHYRFYGSVPLSPFARIARAAIALLIVAGVVGGSVSSWWKSDGHRGQVAFDAAAALEKKGARDEATAAYETMARDYAGRVDRELIAEAGAGVVRTGLSSLPVPFTEGAVDVMGRLVRRYQALPPAARSDASTGSLTEGLLRGARDIGADTTAGGAAERAATALRLLALAKGLGPAATKQTAEQRAALRRGLIEGQAEEWPVDAFAMAAEGLEDPATLALAERILPSLRAEPSLMNDAREDVEAFVAEARKAGRPGEALDAVGKELQEARAAAEDEARRTAVTEGDRAALARYAKANGKDQEVAMALAGIDASDGKLDAAEHKLRALGKPGRTIADAQRFLASLLAAKGKLDEAEAILVHHVGARLPRFQRAAQAYDQQRRETAQSLVAGLRAGDVPAELRASLQAAGDDDAKHDQAINDHLRRALDADPALETLRTTYARHAAVVPSVLALGRVKLQRSQAQSGAARKATLDEAERLFLAIRAESEGQPGFHLALGQVYFRLGRTEEGEAQFKPLLDGEPAEKIELVEVYRDLGLSERARALAEKVYEEGDGAMKFRAAHLRALIASDLGDRETWLRRSDTSQEQVALELDEARADRLYEQGKESEADAIYAKVAATLERGAQHNPVAANNAALSHQERFRCTGDAKHLDAALRLLEAAFRGQPDSAMVAGNLAATTIYAGQVRVLERVLPMRVLRPTSHESEALIASLLDGPRRAELLGLLRSEPHLRRANEVLRQFEVLSPQWTQAYEQEIDLAGMLDDRAAPVAIEQRVNAQPALDTAAGARNYERWVAGELDEEVRRSYQGRITRSARLAAAARDKGDKAAAGAALAMQALTLGERGFAFGTVEDLDQAVALQREAHQLWPAGGERLLAWALVEAAILHARADSPEMATLWKEAQRRYSPHEALLAVRASGAAATEAVRKRAELREALELLRADPGSRPALSTLVVARVAGDEPLATREHPAITDADLLASARLQVRLHPERPGGKRIVEFVEAGGK